MTGDRPSPSTILADTEVERELPSCDYSSNDPDAGCVPLAEVQVASASLGELPHEEEDIKPQIKKQSEVDGYIPVDDLLVAFALLPSNMIDLSSSTTLNAERDETRVKIEPRNDDDNASHCKSSMTGGALIHA